MTTRTDTPGGMSPLKWVAGWPWTSGGCIAIAWGALWENQYWLAYAAFALSGGLALYQWRRSKFLQSWRLDQLPKAIRRDSRLRERAEWRFETLRDGGCLLVLLATVFAVAWARDQARSFRLTSEQGLLLPASELTPDAPEACAGMPPLPEGVFAIYGGGSRLHANSFPASPIVEQDGTTPIISIERDADRLVSLTADFKSRDGKIVARIKKNQFTLNENNRLSKHRPDESTLIVVNEEGEEAINLRYLNPTAIELKAVMYYGGGMRLSMTAHEILFSDARSDPPKNLRAVSMCSTYSVAGPNGVIFAP